MKPKLTVELVPKTCWTKNLRSELTKKEWDNIRKDCYIRAGYRCEICGDKGQKHPVECHEIWHYDDIEKIQTLKGVIALCPLCHICKHFGYARIIGKEEHAKLHLAKVNNWSEQDVEYYLDAVFEQYAQRSNFNWKIDLSWIENINKKENTVADDWHGI